MKRLFVFLLLFFTYPSICFATTGAHYFDPTASGANPDGSFGNPFYRITQVNQHTFAAGEDLYFKVATECTNASGCMNSDLNMDWSGVDSNNYAVIGAYYGEDQFGLNGNARPKIDGDNASTIITSSDSLIGVTSQEYVHIKDLEVRESNAIGIQLATVNYSIVENCFVTQSWENSIIVFNGYENVVKYNTVSYHSLGPGMGATISINGGRVYPPITHSNTVQYNQVHMGDSGEGIGIYHKAYNCIIEYNEIIADNSGTYCIYLDPAGESIIRYNLVYNDGAHVGNERGLVANRENFGNYCESADGSTFDLDDYQIYGNIFMGLSVGLQIGSSDSYPGCSYDGTLIYNNTFVDNNIGLRFIDVGVHNNNIIGSGLEVKNNLFYITAECSTCRHTTTPTVDGVTWANNLFSSTITGDAATSAVIGTPSLNTTSGYRSLTSGAVTGTEVKLEQDSLAIDAAVAIANHNDRLTATDTDFTGVEDSSTTSISTTTDSTPDIGAFAFVEQETNQPPLISSMTPSGNIIVDVDESFNVSVTATDPESTTLTYNWQTSTDQSTWTSISTSASDTHSYTGASTNYIRVLVTDQSGAGLTTTSNTRTVTVQSGGPTGFSNILTSGNDVTAHINFEASTGADVVGSHEFTTENGNPTYAASSCDSSDNAVTFDRVDDNLQYTGGTDDFGWTTSGKGTVFFKNVTVANLGVGYQRIFIKGDDASNDAGFSFLLNSTGAGDNKMKLYGGITNGTDFGTVETSVNAIAATTCYNLAFGFDDSDESGFIYIYNASTGSLVEKTDITFDEELSGYEENNADSYIGSVDTAEWGGSIGSVIFFDVKLSADELHALSNDCYPLATITSVTGVSADGTYGKDDTVTISLNVEWNGESTTITATDGGANATVEAETGAADLTLTSANSASNGSLEFTSASIAENMASADLDLKAGSVTLNDMAIKYNSNKVNIDPALPANSLATNAAIVIDAVLPTFATEDVYHCNSSGTQINDATTYNTDDVAYLCIDEAGSDNLFFANGPVSNLKIGVDLDAGTDDWNYYDGIGTSTLIYSKTINEGDRNNGTIAVDGTAEDTGIIHGTTKIVNASNDELTYTLNSTTIGGGAITISGQGTVEDPLVPSTTVTALLASYVLFIPLDNIELSSDTDEAAALDLSGQDGTSGNVITYNGDGNAWSTHDNLTFGDFSTVKRVRF